MPFDKHQPKVHSTLAGEEGFEPSDGGSKVRCLTTWRLPSGTSILPADRLSDRVRSGLSSCGDAGGITRDGGGLPRQPVTDGVHELQGHLEHGHVAGARELVVLPVGTQ